MSKCLIKSGFFVLRPCHAPSVARCPVCKRPVCEQHFVAERASEYAACTECSSVQSSVDPKRPDLSLMTGRGVYSYRRHYYALYHDTDMLDDLDDDGVGEGFTPEDAEAFNAPSEAGDLDDDLGFDDDAADLFDS